MSRRQEILRRATEVFERQGVMGTSIEDIAKAVGIKREGVYYYFKSRADILLEIILPRSNTLLMNLKSIARTDMTPTEKIEAGISNHLDAFTPNYFEMSVALRENHFFRNEERLKELRRIWKEYGEQWTALVREGQDRGAFKAEIDPKMAAFGILGMCNWVSRWYHPDGDLSIPEITRTFFTMVGHGLVAQGGGDGGER